jgi:hypothetical protein
MRWTDPPRNFDPEPWYLEELDDVGAPLTEPYFAWIGRIDFAIATLACEWAGYFEKSPGEGIETRSVEPENSAKPAVNSRYVAAMTGQMAPVSDRTVAGVSFFGTDRLVRKVGIEIHESQEDGECFWWFAEPSRTDDDPYFSAGTSEDFLALRVHLPTERYRQLERFVRSRSLLSATVSVLGRTSGFYKPRTSLISQQIVKILTADVSVEGADAHSATVPRLSLSTSTRDIGGVSLTVKVRTRLGRRRRPKRRG